MINTDSKKIKLGLHENRITSIGLYFGYPECCITYFTNHIYNGRKPIICKKPISRIQSRVSKHKGFIPCPYCSWKIISKQTTIENLIKNRICNTNYPVHN
jgi:hypothetical protein